MTDIQVHHDLDRLLSCGFKKYLERHSLEAKINANYSFPSFIVKSFKY
jgi:hypothetical protein